MKNITATFVYLAAVNLGLAPLHAQPQTAFRIAPAAEALLDNHCSSCHGEDSQKGDVRFDKLGAMPLAERFALLNRMQEQAYLGFMPPKSRKSQPTAAERKALLDWIGGELRLHNASTLEDKLRLPAYGNYVDHDKLFSGEITDAPFTPAPSAAGARRLTNFEYENTMRDLPGVDLRLKQSLPEDPVKPYHFNNTAEFMLMGPEQIERYLECARRALASAIVDPAKPEMRTIRREWKPKGEAAGMAINQIGVCGSSGRTSVAGGMAIHNPPKIGEFRIRFQAAAIPPEGTREIPLRIVMGESLNVNSSTLRIEPVGTVRLRNSPDAPEIFELRGRLENFPLADSTGAMTQLTA